MHCTFCYVLRSAFSCAAGEFLEMSAQECTQCASGTYSLGSGLRLDEWDDIPPGFSSLATSPDGQNASTCSRSVPLEGSVLYRRNVLIWCALKGIDYVYPTLNRNKIQMHKRQHAFQIQFYSQSDISKLTVPNPSSYLFVLIKVFAIKHCIFALSFIYLISKFRLKHTQTYSCRHTHFQGHEMIQILNQSFIFILLYNLRL